MITFIYYCLYHKSVESFQHDEETFYWFLTYMLNITNGTSIIKKKIYPIGTGIQNFLTLSEKWEPGSASLTSKLICNDSIECWCESSLQWPPALFFSSRWLSTNHLRYHSTRLEAKKNEYTSNFFLTVIWHPADDSS